MDISNEYIQMCVTAIDIQELWTHSRRTSGDWYYNVVLDKAYVVSFQEQRDEVCYWLPRQDQLQELLTKKLGWKLRALRDALNITLWKIHSMDSFEKAWLCTVMKNLYWKEWNSLSQKWEEKLVNKKRFI